VPCGAASPPAVTRHGRGGDAVTDSNKAVEMAAAVLVVAFAIMIVLFGIAAMIWAL
jgi:hypothetical protein